MQAFTFYASDDKLDNRGHGAAEKHTGKAINMKAAELAKQVSTNIVAELIFTREHSVIMSLKFRFYLTLLFPLSR
jgi:hypothetical protein